MTLHVVSGDAGLAKFQEEGFHGRVAVQRDSPAVGPWDADPERCRALRSAFWEVDAAEPIADLDLQPGEAIRLHFTAEPWDQLAQLVVLSALDGRLSPGTLHIETGPLTPADAAEALACFSRIAAQDWRGLERHLPRPITSLPHLLPALLRVLEDHPVSGLGRTERQILSLQAEGFVELQDLMPRLAALEQPWGIVWYGDSYVAKLLATPR